MLEGVQCRPLSFSGCRPNKDRSGSLAPKNESSEAEKCKPIVPLMGKNIEHIGIPIRARRMPAEPACLLGVKGEIQGNIKSARLSPIKFK